MKPSASAQNGTVIPSLFQIAAYFEDFVSAGGLEKITPRLSQTPFADLMLQPKKLMAVLQSTKIGNNPVAAAPRNAMPSSIAHTTRSAMSKKRDGSNRSGSNGCSSGELRKVEFLLKAPVAKSVKLAGDFTDWEKSPVEMMHSPDGVWFTVVPLVPGSYSYRFIVDGQWQDDPRSARRVPNPFGSDNAIVEVT